MPEYCTIGLSEIDAIKPLWESLHVHHSLRCRNFDRWFASYDFTNRKADILRKAENAEVRIEVVKESTFENYIAYCVTSAGLDGVGEVESLFVQEEYRGHGIGKKLMDNAMAWLRKKETICNRIIVHAGNEEVLPFYAQYGFNLRCTVLEQQ